MTTKAAAIAWKFYDLNAGVEDCAPDLCPDTRNAFLNGTLVGRVKKVYECTYYNHYNWSAFLDGSVIAKGQALGLKEARTEVEAAVAAVIVAKAISSLAL